MVSSLHTPKLIYLNLIHGLSPFTEINSVLLVGKSIALNYENPTKYVCSLYVKY
jgi:hypothetical protein